MSAAPPGRQEHEGKLVQNDLPTICRHWRACLAVECLADDTCLRETAEVAGSSIAERSVSEPAQRKSSDHHRHPLHEAHSSHAEGPENIGAGEALRPKSIFRFQLAIPITYDSGQFSRWTYCWTYRSPLNLARVPLKTRSTSMEIREVLAVAPGSATLCFRLTR